MKRYCRSLFLWICLTKFVFSESPSTLRLAQVLFRHGDRTPTDDFPTNPYSEDDWPNGYNQLTQLGMRQMRGLGEFLQRRYSGFLNSTYVKDEVYVRSTDKDRTLMSAAALLAGLYPPAGFQQWADNIQWQPVPVHTRPFDTDIEMSVDAPCDVYNSDFAAALTSGEADRLLSENREMIDYVARHAGWPEVSLRNTWATFDPLYCMLLHNYTWPAWVTPDVFTFLETFYPNEYRFWFATQRQLYFKAGPFLNLMVRNLQDAVEKANRGRRLFLYSSHDSMLAAILIALDNWNNLKPPYASAVIFELHEDPDGQYFVRVFHKNNTEFDPLGSPVPLVIKGCASHECSLPNFLASVAPLQFSGSYVDWQRECGGAKTVVLYQKQHWRSGIGIAVAGLIILLVVLVSIAVLLVKRKHRQTSYTGL